MLPATTDLLLRFGLNPARITVLVSWGARLVSAATQLVTIPILVRSMGGDVYGVYVVTISLFGWYMLADLGIGYTLQNKISNRRAASAAYADDIVSNVVGLLAVLPLLLFLAGFVGPFIARIVWTPAQLAFSDGGRLIVVAGAAFVLTAFGNLAYRILYAEQVGYLANLVQGLASLLSMMLVLFGSRVEMAADARLMLMVLAYALPQTLLSIGMLARSFARARAQGGQARAALFVQTVRGSTGFFTFGVLSLVTLQVDYMVLVSTVPPDEIVKYSVIAKVLGLTLILFQAVLQAHWPSCAEAASRKDWRELNTRLFGLIRLGAILVIVGGATYAVFEHRIMAVVSPKAPATLGFGVVALYTGYLLIRIWSDSYAMVLQSMGKLKIFVLFVPAQAALSLLLQILLARTYGVPGLIVGLVASFLLSSCWVLPIYLRRVEHSGLDRELPNV